MISTSGIDVQLDWSIAAPGIGGERGSVFTNIVFNYLDKYKVQNNPGGPTFDYAGSIGSTIFVPPYGAQFRWKLNTTLGYDFGPGTVSMNWRHLPGAKNVAAVTNAAAQQTRTKAYDIFDLSGMWRINKMSNIIGALPGTTAAVGEPDPAGTYDVMGRRFYVGVKVDF